MFITLGTGLDGVAGVGRGTNDDDGRRAAELKRFKVWRTKKRRKQKEERKERTYREQKLFFDDLCVT